MSSGHVLSGRDSEKPQAMFESLSKSGSIPRRMNLARKRTTVPKFPGQRTPQMGRENPKKDGPSKVMKKEAMRMSAEQSKVGNDVSTGYYISS